MKSELEVRNWFKDHKIDTGGAINEYNFTITTHDDGDVYCKVVIPLWSQNCIVTTSVINLLPKILMWDPHADIFFDKNSAIAIIYESCYCG